MTEYQENTRKLIRKILILFIFINLQMKHTET